MWCFWWFQSLSQLLDKMKELEVDIPLVRSYVAKFAAQAVAGDIVSLVQVSEPFENGVHYPLFMLTLQQLHKAQDKEWLTKTFNESKIDLANMLPGKSMPYPQWNRPSYMTPTMK